MPLAEVAILKRLQDNPSLFYIPWQHILLILTLCEYYLHNNIATG